MSSTVVVRKFGTDLSNVGRPKNPAGFKKGSHKHPQVPKLPLGSHLSQSVSKKQDISKETSQIKIDIDVLSHNPISQSPTPTSSVSPIDTPHNIEEQLECSLEEILQDPELQSLVVYSTVHPETVDLSKPSKHETCTKNRNAPLHYSRDFLMSFQKACTKPVNNLLEDVLQSHERLRSPRNIETAPSFQRIVSPRSPRPVATPKVAYVPKPASTAPVKQDAPIEKLPVVPETVATPVESVVALAPTPSTTVTSEKVKQAEKTTATAFPAKTEQLATTPASPAVVEVPVLQQEPALKVDMPAAAKAAKPSAPAKQQPAQEKKQKQKETDQRRIAQRQKQIEIGINTPGWKRYQELTPPEKRTREFRPPDVHQVCSKRSWDGQVRKWRRMLHLWDPPGWQNKDEDALEGGEDEDEEPEMIAHQSSVIASVEVLVS